MILTFVGRTYNLDEGKLERVAKAAFSNLGISNDEGTIELKFVSEAEIVSLNKQYRGYSKPTDVLSFQLETNPLVGQLFICYTFTKKQAKTVGKSFFDEVSLLLVHGILHLVGYDHANPSEERKMQTLEREILNKEGIDR